MQPNALPYSQFEPRTITLADIPPHWIDPVFTEANRVSEKPGWNPKLVKLEGTTHMYNLCIFNMPPNPIRWQTVRKVQPYVQLVHSIDIIQYEDHPFLATLPANAPRAVKSIYRKEVRLKHLRTTDGGDTLNDLYAADAAWDKFNREQTT